MVTGGHFQSLNAHLHADWQADLSNLRTSERWQVAWAERHRRSFDDCGLCFFTCVSKFVGFALTSFWITLIRNRIWQTLPQRRAISLLRPRKASADDSKRMSSLLQNSVSSLGEKYRYLQLVSRIQDPKTSFLLAWHIHKFARLNIFFSLVLQCSWQFLDLKKEGNYSVHLTTNSECSIE